MDNKPSRQLFFNVLGELIIVELHAENMLKTLDSASAHRVLEPQGCLRI